MKLVKQQKKKTTAIVTCRSCRHIQQINLPGPAPCKKCREEIKLEARAV